jgi:hypothetical protein
MPQWKPKTPYEKFLAELKRLETRIAAKKAELAELEMARKQFEEVVRALAGRESDKTATTRD